MRSFATAAAAYGRFYYVKDHLVSVRSVVDDEGAVVEAADRHPFGVCTGGREERMEQTREGERRAPPAVVR